MNGATAIGPVAGLPCARPHDIRERRFLARRRRPALAGLPSHGSTGCAMPRLTWCRCPSSTSRGMQAPGSSLTLSTTICDMPVATGAKLSITMS